MAIDFDAASLEYLQAISEFADLRCANARQEATFSFWIKTTQVSPASTDWQSPCTCGREQSGDNDCMWGWIDNGGAGVSKICMSWSATSGSNILKSASNVNDDVWHHIAMTKRLSDARFQIFFDGVLDATKFQDSGSPTTTFDRIAARVGGPNNYIDGLLDDVRVYNRVLFDNEIASLATQRGGDGNFEGLVHLYKMDEGAPGTTVSGSNSVKDTVGGNDCTPAVTPTYEEQVVRSRRAA